ncbi:Dps family protein [soil metagenome]
MKNPKAKSKVLRLAPAHDGAPKVSSNGIEIGLSSKQREAVNRALNVALANSYVLLTKTKKAHWDVVGPQFMTLHKLWDEQYTAIAELADEIAERIRMLGGFPLGTLQGFLATTELAEEPGNVPSATDGVSMLLRDHEAIIRSLRKAIEQCDGKWGDAGTADFLTGMMEQHEKMAWMLRSFLQGAAVASSGERARDAVIPRMA